MSKPADEKLGMYEKPFGQAEVSYTTTTSAFATRCEVCRFFRQQDTYDPCLLVPNNVPAPIVTGGFCEQFKGMREEFIFDIEVIDGDLAISLETMGEIAGERVTIEGESGLKVINDTHWVAWYSNNFRDKDDELFTTKSIDSYNAAVKSGEWPAPDLWHFHQAYLKHGTGKATFRLGHFQLAVGVFDDPGENTIVTKMIEYYKNHRVTMSHGYYWDPELYEDGKYHWHRTFEVSTLQPGREANPYFTTLEERKTMAKKLLSGKDREYVANILGEDELAKLEARSAKSGSLLEDLGVEFKTEDAQGDTDGTKMGEDMSTLILVNAKLSAQTAKAVYNAEQGIKAAANMVVQSDERLGMIEQKITRLSQLVIGLVDPKQSSKTRDPGADNNAALDDLLEKNHAPPAGSNKGLSLVEQLAIYAGDDPAIYRKEGDNASNGNQD